ncbi:MAG: hypothetical protein AB7O77_15925 [Phycisphaerales bacterium]
MTRATQIATITANITWPSDRCYWAVLDIPGYRPPRPPGSPRPPYSCTRPLPPALLIQLQDHVPIDVSELHAVAMPLPITAASSSNQLLVCAVRRDDLAGVDPQAVTLAPNLPSAPELAGLPNESLGPVNLLVGEFEPRPVRRARLRRHLELAAVSLAVVLLIAVGLHRRAKTLEVAAQHAQDSLAGVLSLDQMVGPDSSLDSGAEHLNAQLRLVSQVQGAARQVTPPFDAASPLAALLRSWPTNVTGAPCSIQSITVNATSMSVSFISGDDPNPLLRILVAPDGWRLEEPRITSVPGTTRVLQELRPIDAARKGAP